MSEADMLLALSLSNLSGLTLEDSISSEEDSIGDVIGERGRRMGIWNSKKYDWIACLVNNLTSSKTLNQNLNRQYKFNLKTFLQSLFGDKEEVESRSEGIGEKHYFYVIEGTL